MKRFFLLALLMLSFAVIQAKGVVEPPGWMHENLICIGQGSDHSTVLDVAMLTVDDFTVVADNASYMPVQQALDVIKTINHDGRGHIYARDCVLNSEFLFNNIYKKLFNPIARSWVHLQRYSCNSMTGTPTANNNNFDGSPGRFY